MTPMLAGLVGFLALFILLAVRMPIGLAMMTVGAAGIAVLNSPNAALNNLGSFAFSYSAVFTLSVIPLFVLMGAFASTRFLSAFTFGTRVWGDDRSLRDLGVRGWPVASPPGHEGVAGASGASA